MQDMFGNEIDAWSDISENDDVTLTPKDKIDLSNQMLKEDKQYHIIYAWKDKNKLENELKKKYGSKLLWIFGGEIGVSMILLILMGVKIIELEEWTINIFFTAVFTHTSIMVVHIIKHLFPITQENILKFLEDK